MKSIISIQKWKDNSMKVLYPHNPKSVEKIRAINGRRLYPEGNYWSFPNPYGLLEKIIDVKNYLLYLAEEKHITVRTVQKIFDSACRRAFIKKDVTVHSHSKTTEIYTLVTKQSLRGIKSPLDFIKIKKGGNPYGK